MSRQREQRLNRRLSFDEIASLYDRARPAYPTSVIDSILSAANIRPRATVLEIGCGSGQLTVPLALHDASITALELGSNLAALARQRTARFPSVGVIEADFDLWAVPRDAFDVVVAATSFHWLDPNTRATKCLDALRPGGTLLVLETHWSAGSGADAFFLASQACYARWDPSHDPDFKPALPDELPARHQELEVVPSFQDIRVRDVVHERSYSAAAYRALLETFSDVRALGPSSATGLAACVERLIETQFSGAVPRKDLYRVWSATKAY